MKKILFTACISMSACIFFACNSASNSGSATDSSSSKDTSAMSSTTSTSSSTDTSGKMAMSSTPVPKDDSEYAMKAAIGGMEEVQMGQLAQQNAMSQRVKDFGAMMVKDHTAAGDKLKGIASSKGLMLPTSLDKSAQKDYDDMAKKTGKDFDKAYVSMMVDDHKTDIKDFQKEAQNGKDTDLKNFASTTLPTLQLHLDSIQAIHKSY
jgi:putative membrane protein